MLKIDKKINTGSCLCGNISFTVNSLMPLVGHCHCNMCQKFHGAAFSTFVEVNKSDVNWLDQHDYLTSYRADNETIRQFCRNCGSSLTFESKYNRQQDTIEIALASFDVIEHVEPNAHIYTESKVNWISINDNLNQFKTYRK